MAYLFERDIGMALPVIDREKGLISDIGQGKGIGKEGSQGKCRRLTGEWGFTMIEMMIALFILVVSILGLTTLTITSIQANHQNDLRNTAIKLTSEVAEIILAQPIENIVSGSLTPYDASNTAISSGTYGYKQYPNPVQAIKGGTVPYTVTWIATSLTGDLTQVNITVAYTYRGQQYTNNAIIYKHRVT